MKGIYITALTIFLSGGINAAMLPFSEDEEASTSKADLTATLTIILAGAEESNDVLVKLLNHNTNEERNLDEGVYHIQPGSYEIRAFTESFKDEVNLSFTQYKTSFRVSDSNSKVVNIPILKRRRYGTWADYLSISLQGGTLNGDYEVTSLLNEYYTKLGTPNSYPKVNTISENDSNAQSRIGLSLNYKHLFSASSWLIYGDFFSDSDGNQRLDRTGYSVGMGKYWGSKNSTYWFAGGIGSEAAKWNGINIGGDTSVSISGSHETQTLNLEVGIIYRPLNTSLSVKFDPYNESLMMNLGYVLGKQSKGYIDPVWAD
jgi:hypothetical protein